MNPNIPLSISIVTVALLIAGVITISVIRRQSNHLRQ
jgi:hypothetical protein